MKGEGEDGNAGVHRERVTSTLGDKGGGGGGTLCGAGPRRKTIRQKPGQNLALKLTVKNLEPTLCNGGERLGKRRLKMGGGEGKNEEEKSTRVMHHSLSRNVAENWELTLENLI